MTTVSGKGYSIGRTTLERKTDFQSRARTSRREIEREARRQQPKRARPKTAKGFSLTPQNMETE